MNNIARSVLGLIAPVRSAVGGEIADSHDGIDLVDCDKCRAPQAHEPRYAANKLYVLRGWSSDIEFFAVRWINFQALQPVVGDLHYFGIALQQERPNDVAVLQRIREFGL